MSNENSEKGSPASPVRELWNLCKKDIKFAVGSGVLCGIGAVGVFRTGHIDPTFWQAASELCMGGFGILRFMHRIRNTLNTFEQSRPASTTKPTPGG